VRTRMAGNRFVDCRFEVEPAEPRAIADPFPRDGERAVFERGAVRVETADGEVLESRTEPRAAFFGLSGVRRNLRWDALDSIYFAGYAMWNYLTTPLLLTREGVEVTEIEPWRAAGETRRRLAASFPDGLDTHSREQVFYFDDDRRLCRHDYVAEVIGGWARAAHMCAEHVASDGMVFPTRRWVRPIGPGNRALRFPTLVSLHLSQIEVQ
jgi:hypothetical protein